MRVDVAVGRGVRRGLRTRVGPRRTGGRGGRTSRQGGAAAPAKAADKAAGEKTPYRRLAPGVMVCIDPDPRESETFSRHDINEVLAGGRKLPWAKDVAFRHDVFNLQFSFKPVRMMYVDVPQTSGQMQRELIWYMVYSVTNAGKTMHPVADPDGTLQDRAGRPEDAVHPQVLSGGLPDAGRHGEEEGRHGLRRPRPARGRGPNPPARRPGAAGS